MQGEAQKVITALVTIDSLYIDIETVPITSILLMIILSLNNFNLRNLRIIDVCECFSDIIVIDGGDHCFF